MAAEFERAARRSVVASASNLSFDASIAAAPQSLRDLAIALRHLEYAQRRLRQRFAKRLGLSLTDYSAIMTVGERGEVTPKELATTLNMTPGSITTVLDRLTAAGYVYRIPHPDDRRSLHIALTEKAVQAKMQIYRDFFTGVAQSASTHPHILHPQIAAAIALAADAADATAQD